MKGFHSTYIDVLCPMFLRSIMLLFVRRVSSVVFDARRVKQIPSSVMIRLPTHHVVENVILTSNLLTIRYSTHALPSLMHTPFVYIFHLGSVRYFLIVFVSNLILSKITSSKYMTSPCKWFPCCSFALLCSHFVLIPTSVTTAGTFCRASPFCFVTTSSLLAHEFEFRIPYYIVILPQIPHYWWG